MKTRTTKAKQPRTGSTPLSAKSIPEKDPVRLLLLPQDAGPDARTCTLAHPATSKPCRYYWSPSKGLYEFQRIAAPRNASRSWLLIPKAAKEAARKQDEATSEDPMPMDRLPENQVNGLEHLATVNSASTQNAHTIQAPEIMVATPIDILFIILPALYAQIANKSKGLFLSLDDLIDAACDTSRHLKIILEHTVMRHRTEQRIDMVCDNVEAGDEKMYRLNVDRLLQELLSIAKRLQTKGLPPTMEAKFVDKALEVPMRSVKREDSSMSQTANNVSRDTDLQDNMSAESQPSTTASQSVESEASIQTNITVPDQPAPVHEEIRDLLRLRTALQFVTSSYLPRPLISTINDLILSPSCSINFKPLEDHLAHIAKLRAEALAARSLSDFSLKRSLVEDDEVADERAEKRRKKEEEEKRQKSGPSKGVRDLKKVDVSCMKKMSDFFGKKPVTKGK
ncbi:MAG: hypothetical protein LQ350_005411 [Teloschistes chrysophthalmus]|nr:MAG: hypothetical protein LQ350_005411 [Niorma chrysophthalma]